MDQASAAVRFVSARDGSIRISAQEINKARGVDIYITIPFAALASMVALVAHAANRPILGPQTT
jgi:hypothetical protein